MKTTPAHTCPDCPFELVRPVSIQWASGPLRSPLMPGMISETQNNAMRLWSCGTPCHTLDIVYKDPVSQCATHGQREVPNSHGVPEEERQCVLVAGTVSMGKEEFLIHTGCQRRKDNMFYRQERLVIRGPSSFSPLPHSTG